MTRQYQYEGVMHVHSVYSDGTGTVPEIMTAAAALGLDYVILTDHNTNRARTDGYERFYPRKDGGKAMCLVCYELNDAQNQNHYLTLGLDSVVGRKKTAADYVSAVTDAGGFGVIAHPHEKRGAIEKYPPYPWTAWNAAFDGIEIWNQMSEWMEGLCPNNQLARFLHPLKSIVAPPKETLALWDKLNQTRRVFAVGSVDAHAHFTRFLGIRLRVFPYKVCFKSIRTTAVLREPIDTMKPVAEERHKLYTALRRGNAFISNASVGASKGFSFTAHCPDKSAAEPEFLMGDDVAVALTPALEFSIVVPTPCTIRLLRNGAVVKTIEGTRLEHTATESGVYRVECLRDGRAWIFSNAIRYF